MAKAHKRSLDRHHADEHACQKSQDCDQIVSPAPPYKRDHGDREYAENADLVKVTRHFHGHVGLSPLQFCDGRENSYSSTTSAALGKDSAFAQDREAAKHRELVPFHLTIDHRSVDRRSDRQIADSPVL